MPFTVNDGGRAAAGFKGVVGDCVTRSVAIALERDYRAVYEALSEGTKNQRKTHRSARMANASHGVNVRRKWFRDYMAAAGWEFVATMGIGTGCKVHLVPGELPTGRLIVVVSKHYSAVIDGVIHDIFDPQRDAHIVEPDNGRELRPGEWRNKNGICRIAYRCVYGYWKKASHDNHTAR